MKNMGSSEQSAIVSTDFLSKTIDQHIRVTGTRPCELFVPLSFLVFQGVKINVHNQPWTCTWDGQRLIQHPNPKEYSG